MKTLADTLLITRMDKKILPHLPGGVTEGRQSGQVIVPALLSGSHASELRVFQEQENSHSLVGNIYIGKVRKIQKNLDVAFIEIAGKQQCYYNICEDSKPFFTKRGNTDRIVEGDELVVQVKRDGIKTKLPAVTSRLELPGRYLVLIAGDCQVGVSGKLSGDAKRRLRTLVSPFITEQYGFIVRTNAGSASDWEIEQEALALKEQYNHIMNIAPHRTCFSMLRGEVPPWISMLRDLNIENLEAIKTDLPDIYAEIQEYGKYYYPEILEKLSFYQDDLLPLYKLYDLERELTQAIQERVWLKSGGYLVIQPTEALTVIDVNTGKYSEKKIRCETLKKINLEAAKESARQIRLRNLSGIILIDFINMENHEEQAGLLEYLAQLLKKDPVKTRLIDMTKLELVEITRQKVQKSLAEQIREAVFCPHMENRKNIAEEKRKNS